MWRVIPVIVGVAMSMSSKSEMSERKTILVVEDEPDVLDLAASFLAAEGYELILGASLDSQFGPVLMFGTGGQLVEIFRDRALALPPTPLGGLCMLAACAVSAIGFSRGAKVVAAPALPTAVVRS